MSLKFGVNEQMNVGKELEKDGTLSFHMDFFEHGESYDLVSVLDRDQAVELVNHLKKLFKI